MSYTFEDSKGTERTVDIPCVVQPELVNHVTGLSDIEIDYGEPLPEVDCTYDEYVNSVTRTEDVNVEEPGTYPVTYTILGANGEMEEVEYTCTVNDTRPSPTPTPTPEPVKETEVETETEIETENTTEEETEVAVGNVPQTEIETVQTGDTSNITVFVSAIILCVGVNQHDRIHTRTSSVRRIFILDQVINEVPINCFINDTQQMILWNQVIHTNIP